MLHCPGCQGPVPEGKTNCPHCGRAILAPPPMPKLGRPVPRAAQATDIQVGPSWAPQAYRIVSWLWVANGSLLALFGLLLTLKTVLAWLLVPVGALYAFLGAGLLQRQPRIRKGVTFLCVLQILSGLGGVWDGFWGGAPFHMILGAAEAALGAFTVFLIGETDVGPPEL